MFQSSGLNNLAGLYLPLSLMLFFLCTSKVNLLLDCSNGLLLETLVLEHCDDGLAFPGLDTRLLGRNVLKASSSSVRPLVSG